MEDTDRTEQEEVYYVISLKRHQVSNHDATPSIMIDGDAYKKDNIFVAKRINRDSTIIYTYLPNDKVWFPNSGITDSFWNISLGYEPIAYEKISQEQAYTLAADMRDYDTPLASILMTLYAGQTLPH